MIKYRGRCVTTGEMLCHVGVSVVALSVLFALWFVLGKQALFTLFSPWDDLFTWALLLGATVLGVSMFNYAKRELDLVVVSWESRFDTLEIYRILHGQLTEHSNTGSLRAIHVYQQITDIRVRLTAIENRMDRFENLVRNTNTRREQ